MSLEHVLLTNAVTVGAVLFLLWCLSILLRNVSIIDIFWGCGFVLIAWVSLWASGHEVARSILLVVIVTLWGIRLAGYLAWRNRGKPEDYRYASMRERHGSQFPMVSLFTVFALQGVLMWVVSLPIQVGISRGEGLQISVAMGVVLWVFGLFFETVGDLQLAYFKNKPENRGRVMDRGLWRYTRHPNYFGDFLVWWGFYFVATDSGTWWWTIIGPLLMSFLLIRVSGVRLLEDSLQTRVTGYKEYVRNTSTFFPLPPRQTRQPD